MTAEMKQMESKEALWQNEYYTHYKEGRVFENQKKTAFN